MAIETYLGYWLGPLEPLFADEDVSEIMVLDFDKIFIERRGAILPSDVRLPDRRTLRELIERLLLPLGRELTQASPYSDGRMGEGVRFTATIPPLTPAPTLTIRKEVSLNLPSAWREAMGSDDRALRMLRAFVRSGKNLVIAGAAGTGKTSLLRHLAQDIPKHERILTIEETRELQLSRTHPHVVALETRPANRAGLYAIDLENLVRLALHMRPDRIIVGEIRGREAAAWLTALDTGHPGSLTTVHASSAEDATTRLLAAAARDSSVSMRVLRQRLDALIGGVVHLVRRADGVRIPSAIVARDGGRWERVWP